MKITSVVCKQLTELLSNKGRTENVFHGRLLGIVEGVYDNKITFPENRAFHLVVQKAEQTYWSYGDGKPVRFALFAVFPNDKFDIFLFIVYEKTEESIKP